MIGRLINLPFKVLGKVARTVQDRNDAAMKARHGDGDTADSFAEFERNAEKLGERVPPDYDAGPTDMDASRALADQRGGRKTLYVDVRSENAWRAGHITGALHMPLGAVHIRLAELPPDERVVVYCDDGRRSREAVIFLRVRGLEDVYAMNGGLAAYKAAGGATQGGAT